MATSKIPNRNIQNFTTAQATSVTYTLYGGYRGLLVVNSSNAAHQGLWIIAMGNNGTLYSTEIKKGAGLTLSNPESNKITITVNEEKSLSVLFINQSSLGVSISS